jgi:hypothetical protein
MARKQKYVVQVKLPPSEKGKQEISGAMFECLRYAGLIRPRLENLETGAITMDLLCPSGSESKPWSEMNAQRMISFGFNAVSQPEGTPLDH